MKKNILSAFLTAVVLGLTVLFLWNIVEYPNLMMTIISNVIFGFIGIIIVLVVFFNIRDKLGK